MGFAKTAALVMPLLTACVTEENAGDEGGGGDPMTDPTGGTKLVSIQVVDALIAPGMSNHEAWDGFGPVPNEVWSGLASALGAPQPYAAVIAFFGQAAVQQLERPDPLGGATLLSAHSSEDGIVFPLATKTTNHEDTFQPAWPTPARWNNVLVTSDLRIRVTLEDEDLSYNDPIGVVELNTQDVEDALRANQVFHAKVNDQASGQVLFIGISVRQTGTSP